MWTVVIAGLLFSVPAIAQSGWPLWDGYASRFLESGRIVDPQRLSSTTSEGQAYALFFSLVANDQPRFQSILNWTQDQLAKGDLRASLPAWHWGKLKSGAWGILDYNSASDADLWLAYTLLEAGRLWRRPELESFGTGIAQRIASEEVAVVPGFGPVLLPGATGFRLRPGTFRINPGYMPLELFDAIGERLPNGPWRQMARSLPAVIQASAPSGVAPDWVQVRDRDQDVASGPTARDYLASYDAIRVYLWAGMLHSDTPGRQDLLSALHGMAKYLRHNTFPPARMAIDGTVQDPHGSPGFSAAVIPFLTALGEDSLVKDNYERLTRETDLNTGLYGRDPNYYDHNLALFGIGWAEGRFRFDAKGSLIVNWS